MLAKLRRRFVLIMMSLVGLVLLVVLALSVVSNYRTTSARIETAIDQAVNRGPEGGQRPWVGKQGNGAPMGGSPDLQGQPPDKTTQSDGQGTQPPLDGQGDTSGKNPGDLGGFGEPPDGSLSTPVYVASIDAKSFAVLSDNSAFVSIDATLCAEALAQVAERLQQEGALTSSPTPSADATKSLRGLLLDSRLIYRVNIAADGSITVALADATTLLDGTIEQVGISTLIWLGAMVVFLFISLLLSKLALRPAAEAWERQRRFVADASHELKTPLTVILANNSLLLAQPDKSVAQQRQWVESTQCEAQRMDSLVRDLLLLAQTDDDSQQGKQDKKGASTFVPCDLSALVRRNLLQFEAVFFERGVNLKVDVADNITINGNDEQLNRLVQILLDNASKYAQGTVTESRENDAEGVRFSVSGPAVESSGGPLDNSPQCSVTLRAGADSGSSGGGGNRAGKRPRALLEIANTGTPIPPDALPHLFERFFRADNAHSDTEGSGLGLSLAQAIVTAHHGTISVRSDATLGTVFTVAF